LPVEHNLSSTVDEMTQAVERATSAVARLTAERDHAHTLLRAAQSALGEHTQRDAEHRFARARTSIDSLNDESLTVRIYVYDLPSKFNNDFRKDGPAANEWCWSDAPITWQTKYSSENYIHRALLASPQRTLDPETADLFFVPVYATCHLHSHRTDFVQTHDAVLEAKKWIEERYTYWQRSAGADHIFALTHDLGGCMAPFEELRHAILLTNTGEMMPRKRAYETYSGIYSKSYKKRRDFSLPCFTPTKDVVIPPMLRDSELLRAPARWTDDITVKRKRLAMFRGAILGSRSYSRGIRQLWQEIYKDEPENGVSIVSRHPKRENEASYKSDYLSDMLSSTFCLCPPGWASWTPRIFEAMLAGCIPVVVTDHNALPFERVTDYSQFSVFVSEKDAGRVKEILEEVAKDEERVARMRAQLRRRWQRMVWTPFSEGGPKVGDAFHFMLMELQSRAAALRRRTRPRSKGK
jgi:glycosyltransferase involved in cell wall biosynthesis